MIFRMTFRLVVKMPMTVSMPSPTAVPMPGHSLAIWEARLVATVTRPMVASLIRLFCFTLPSVATPRRSASWAMRSLPIWLSSSATRAASGFS